MTLSADQGRSQRPWGWFETLATADGYLVKRLLILPGQRISLQRHRHRCEHWVVAAGQGLMTLDGKQLALHPGSQLTIPLAAVHRAEARGVALEIIEVQRGDWLSEEDIERLADDYGRMIPA